MTTTINSSNLAITKRQHNLGSTSNIAALYAAKMGITPYEAIIAMAQWLQLRPDLKEIKNANRLEEIFYLSDALGYEYTDFITNK